MKNINFGIDLGTTNSGIGKYDNGKVQVLKNPVGLRETLPSVVSFYRGRILIGDKARERYLTNAGNVLSVFKRKMGSTEKYEVNHGNETLTLSPVDLSAYVLKELKNYVHGTEIDAAVITIPASFDTIQSNATKQAGYQAGIKQVVLLQEPIAACLAYANLSHLNIQDEQKWLVYDFGGGTFDVALVHINQRELKILDNKGNNFLGGVDIDAAFIAQIIVPKLSAILNDAKLWNKLLNKETSYEKLWHYLIYLAEEAKKQLSVSPSTFIEIDFPDLNIFNEIEISQADLNDVVKPKYEESEKFITELLTDNNLAFTDITRIILVGGTTYIPLIKDSLKRCSGITIDDSIDPTTAVIVGASYYAGAHEQSVETQQTGIAPQVASSIAVKLSFESYSNDTEELLAFKTETPFNGFYRITRLDGGYDSGLLAFKDTASEFVTLLPKMQNTFKLTIFNDKQESVYTTSEISISHGLYSVSGQLLPEDICIELDNNDTNTYLEVVFKRNHILPLSKTIYKTFSKSIIKGSDDRVVFNVVEGKGGSLPGACLSIGYIEISGQQIAHDLIQGTDVEIELNIDESRGLKVDIHIPSSGEQISRSFHLTQREASLPKLIKDVAQATISIQQEINYCNEKEAYELSAKFQHILNELNELTIAAASPLNDLLTEEKYRLDERKRKLLTDFDNLTRARDLHIEISQYEIEKERFRDQEEHANSVQKRDVERILASEKELFASGDKHLIKLTTEKLEEINHQIFLLNDETYVRLFFYCTTLPDDHFKSGANREELINAGRASIANRDIMQLKQIVAVLLNLVKEEHKAQTEKHAPQHGSSTFRTGLK